MSGGPKRQCILNDCFERRICGCLLGDLVRPERFELPTYCSGGLAARETNNLARFVRSCTQQYFIAVPAFFPVMHTCPYKPPLGTELGTAHAICQQCFRPPGAALPETQITYCGGIAQV